MVFVDRGEAVLSAWGRDGTLIDRTILIKGIFDDLFLIHTLMVSGPGIARATLTTPPSPTLGGLVDTLVFSPVPPAPHAPMEVEIRGPRRDVISLGSSLVTVIVLPGHSIRWFSTP